MEFRYHLILRQINFMSFQISNTFLTFKRDIAASTNTMPTDFISSLNVKLNESEKNRDCFIAKSSLIKTLERPINEL